VRVLYQNTKLFLNDYLAYVDPITPLDIVLLNRSGSSVARFKSVRSKASSFDLLENACVVLYEYDRTSSTNSVTVEQVCPDDAGLRELGTVVFPGQQKDHFRSYRTSPQGDRILAYVQSIAGGDIRLYVGSLSGDRAPRLLFSSPSKPCKDSLWQDIGPYQWSPDGKMVELLWSNICDGQAENTFYWIDLEGEPKVRTTIDGISVNGGDWSPDSREFAFWYYPVRRHSRDAPSGDIAGVYVLELETGEWEQVVSEIHVMQILAWPSHGKKN
jgi:hypothetical protein